MSDWQVGDLALCIISASDFLPKAGEIHRVKATQISQHGLHLFFDDLPDEGDDWLGYSPVKFRKIKPDAEPCEEEFTVLIKRMKPAKVKQ